MIDWLLQCTTPAAESMQPATWTHNSMSAACLLVVVARHVLLHALPHRLVLAGGAADHSATHPTLQQHVEALVHCLFVVQIALESSTGLPLNTPAVQR
jgi:hypothetical protein